MEINFLKPKKEDNYLDHFAKVYLPIFYPGLKKITVDSPDSDSKFTAPDYFIQEVNILIEVKEIHDYSGNKELGLLSSSTRWLKEELKARDTSWAKGYFIIETPWNLKIRREDKKGIVDQLLEAIKQGNSFISIDKVGQFKIKKISDLENHITFSSMGEVRSIDPVSTIFENIDQKIATANRQLGSNKTKTDKKILILANKYIFADRSSVVEALSRSVSSLAKYKNIDEIWLILERSGGELLPPELLFTKEFLAELEDGKLAPTPINLKLFEKWFIPLEKINDEYKEKLFLIMKELFAKKKPFELIEADETREHMVQMGQWLINSNRYKDVIWLIDTFIDDPDPGSPEDYKGDPQFNYHERIKEGEDPRVITTVLGHLAWVIQKLVLKEEYISLALQYCKRLFEHPNLYVRLQAIVPLTDMAARRQWLKGWNERPYVKDYRVFHNLAFGLIQLLEENPNYKAIADWTAHLFAYYKDLDTDEAVRVLSAIKTTDDSAGLFVYFGIFRIRHYQDQNIPFDGSVLSGLLKDLIVTKRDPDNRIVASIGWNLWKILHEEPAEFSLIKPYIDLLFTQPYYRDLYGDIEMIIEDWIGKETDISIVWLKQYLDNVIEYLEPVEDVRSQGGLWLTVEQVLGVIVEIRPEELLEIFPKIAKIIRKGGYVGIFKDIFLVYKLIKNPELRKEVKELSQQSYKEVEPFYPNVEKLNWED